MFLGKHTDAEWGAEVGYSPTGRMVALVDFGKVVFTNCQAEVNGTALHTLGHYNNTAVEMYNKSTTAFKADVSAITTNNKGFTVRWDSTGPYAGRNSAPRWVDLERHSDRYLGNRPLEREVQRGTHRPGPLLPSVVAGFIACLVLASGVTTGPGGARSIAALAGPGSAHVLAVGNSIPSAPMAPPVGRGDDWHNLSVGLPSGVPGNRTFAALAYDPALNGTLLFGGFNHTLFGPLDDTWLFANGTWTNLTTSSPNVPSARWAALMTWDPWNSEMVLFGGRDSSSTFNDTWVFQPSGWAQLAPATAPSPRQSQFSVFTADPTLRAIYLGGGSCYQCGAGGTIDNDSWTFVNGTWQNISVGVARSPTILDYGSWDPQTGGIVGYSSTATNCSGTSSTVAFNGTAWSVLNATSPPGPVTQGGGFVFDAVDSVMLLFGGGYPTGSICAFKSNTWTYTNGTWTNETSNLTAWPFARCCESIAYDATQKVVLLVGGAETSQAYIGDTWTFPAAPLQLTLNRSASIGAPSIPVNFSANVSGGSGALSFNWSFGDGSPNSTTSLASHGFAAPGTYLVNFTARDSVGRSINGTLRFPVTPSLSVGAGGAPPSGEAPLRVNFTALASGGAAPFTYSWAFGDGSTAAGANVSHIYRTMGNFTATVTIRDASRQVSHGNVSVDVRAPLSVAVRTSPVGSAGDAPFRINFTAVPSGNASPFSAQWSFGDGSPTMSGLSVSHVYSTSGAFEAIVTVTDGAGHTANGSAIVGVAAPLAATAAVVVAAGLAPFSASFSANAANGTAPYQFDWAFGDGSADATGASASHRYNASGQYVATLTTTDAGGGRVVSTVRIDVVDPLAASIAANLSFGVGPVSVSFASAISGGLSPELYAWSFGDGGTSASANATHRYATVGEFAVNFSVSDGLGEVVHRNLTVDVYAPLHVSASASPAVLDEGATTTLTANAIGGSGSPTYTWGALPPGCGPPTGPTVQCTPTAPGLFTVTVSVLDSRHEPAATSLVLNVSSPPSTTPTSPGSGPSGWAGPASLAAAAVLGGLVGAGAVFLILRRRPRNPADREPTVAAGTDPPEAESSG